MIRVSPAATLPAHTYWPGLRPTLPNVARSEEHTSELQSQSNLVCRLLLEKKKHGTNIDVMQVLPPGPIRDSATTRRDSAGSRCASRTAGQDAHPRSLQVVSHRCRSAHRFA